MRVTQDLNSFVEIIAHVQCSVDEKKIKQDELLANAHL
jgi:hypothetical protein